MREPSQLLEGFLVLSFSSFPVIALTVSKKGFPRKVFLCLEKPLQDFFAAFNKVFR